METDVPGPALLVSLAYLKSSEKLTVIVMKARSLKPISKNKPPGELHSRILKSEIVITLSTYAEMDLGRKSSL